MKTYTKYILSLGALVLLLTVIDRGTFYGQTGKGGNIAFVSDKRGNWDLWSMNRDGSGLRQLTTFRGPDYAPSWSPDGSQIAYTTYQWGGHRIALMNADGSNIRPFLDLKSSYNLYPSWSPDGKQIVFFMVDGRYWQIFKANVDDPKPIKLSNVAASERNPVFSPDGKSIVFQSSRDGTWGIYVMLADGSEQTRLNITSANCFAPAWSLDSKQIVFGSDKDGPLDVFIMNADGTGMKNLTKGRPSKQVYNSESHKDDLSPQFTKDGQSIIFSVGAAGSKAQLYQMAIDGSELRKITDGNTDNRFPSIKK